MDLLRKIISRGVAIGIGMGGARRKSRDGESM